MLNLLQNKSNESGGLNMGLLLGVKMGWMVVQYLTIAFMLWIFIAILHGWREALPISRSPIYIYFYHNKSNLKIECNFYFGNLERGWKFNVNNMIQINTRIIIRDIFNYCIWEGFSIVVIIQLLQRETNFLHSPQNHWSLEL
jgi:hypothetical protein